MRVTRSELQRSLQIVGLRGIRVFLRTNPAKQRGRRGISCPFGPPAPAPSARRQRHI